MKITKAQKEKTMAQILRQALIAFTQEDYENVKLSAISKACHIAEGTLYNYFSDKPTLFIATFIKFRSDNNTQYKVQTPKNFESFMDEFIEILTFYMKIDHPQLEGAFKRFLHLVREQKLGSKNHLEQALLTADQYIYDDVLELLRRVPLLQTDELILFNVIVKQVEGVFDDYLYGDIDFDTFLHIVKDHISFILKPYIYI